MVTREKIHRLFLALNEALGERGETGEVGIVGGSVMCLVYDARKSTKDVDAIFKPVSLIRKLAMRVAENEGVEDDWLNDAAKGFLEGTFKKQDVLSLSHLRVWAPEPRYMLAMKCLSARWDSHDREDVIFLVNFIRLKDSESVFQIIEHYYPHCRIPPKTKFFIQEIFQGLKPKKSGKS